MVGSLKKRHRKPSIPPPNPSIVANPSMKSPILGYRKTLILLFGALLLLTSLLYVALFPRVSKTRSVFYTFDVINEYPHDPSAFTQGLVYGGNDTLYESTGLNGQSSVRWVEIRTGKVIQKHQMDYSHFGEGLTLFKDRLFQVTWLTKFGFIYDRYNLSRLGKFKHEMQDGWGLATDGHVLFGSDGTSTLYKLNSETFKGFDKFTVKYNDVEIPHLNELEYIHGEIWANVWMSDCIARISPETGAVVGWILLHRLRQDLHSSGHKGFDVLNGIAWDEEQDRIFVTGKNWPHLYEIRLRLLQFQEEDIVRLCELRKADQFGF